MLFNLKDPEVIVHLAKKFAGDKYSTEKINIRSKSSGEVETTLVRLTEIKTSFEFIFLANEEKYAVGIFPFFKRNEVSREYLSKAVVSLHMMFNNDGIELPIEGNDIYRSDHDFVTHGSFSGLLLSMMESEEPCEGEPIFIWGLLLPSYLRDHDCDGVIDFIEANEMITTHADPHFYRLEPECLAVNGAHLN